MKVEENNIIIHPRYSNGTPHYNDIGNTFLFKMSSLVLFAVVFLYTSCKWYCFLSNENIFCPRLAVIQLDQRLSFDTRVGKIEMLDEGYIPKTNDAVTIMGYVFNQLNNFHLTVQNFSIGLVTQNMIAIPREVVYLTNNIYRVLIQKFTILRIAKENIIKITIWR